MCCCSLGVRTSAATRLFDAASDCPDYCVITIRRRHEGARIALRMSFFPYGVAARRARSSSSTRRLTGGLFEYGDFRAVALQGVAENIRPGRRLCASAVETRFEALRVDTTPLVVRAPQDQAKARGRLRGAGIGRARHRQLV
jgi:hypothetical protein